MYEEGIRRPFSAICPPAEVLVRAATDGLEDPHLGNVVEHLRKCHECLMRISAIGQALSAGEGDTDSDDEDDLPGRVAGRLAPAGHAVNEGRRRNAPTPSRVAQDWRRLAYNSGDPEYWPRTHLVAARPLTLALVGDTPPISSDSYEIKTSAIDWSLTPPAEQTQSLAEDFQDVSEILRRSCGLTNRRITVFIPAEAAWLVESFLFEDARRWRVFTAEQAPPGRPRKALKLLRDARSGSTYRHVEVNLEESVRASHWLCDKQSIPAGRFTGTVIAALGRVLGRGDGDDLISPDDPLLVVIPADEPAIDEDQLMEHGCRFLFSGP